MPDSLLPEILELFRRDSYLLAEMMRPRPEPDFRIPIPIRTGAPEVVDPPPLPADVRITMSRRTVYYPLDSRRPGL